GRAGRGRRAGGGRGLDRGRRRAGGRGCATGGRGRWAGPDHVIGDVLGQRDRSRGRVEGGRHYHRALTRLHRHEVDGRVGRERDRRPQVPFHLGTRHRRRAGDVGVVDLQELVLVTLVAHS